VTDGRFPAIFPSWLVWLPIVAVVTSDTALRLARLFRTTPEFWMNMQAGYELEIAKDKLSAVIERNVRPYEATA